MEDSVAPVLPVVAPPLELVLGAEAANVVEAVQAPAAAAVVAVVDVPAVVAAHDPLVTAVALVLAAAAAVAVKVAADAAVAAAVEEAEALAPLPKHSPLRPSYLQDFCLAVAGCFPSSPPAPPA